MSPLGGCCPSHRGCRVMQGQELQTIKPCNLLLTCLSVRPMEKARARWGWAVAIRKSSAFRDFLAGSPDCAICSNV